MCIGPCVVALKQAHNNVTVQNVSLTCIVLQVMKMDCIKLFGARELFLNSYHGLFWMPFKHAPLIEPFGC